MPRNKRDPVAIQGTEQHRRTGPPKGGVERMFFEIGQPCHGIQARAAQDA